MKGPIRRGFQEFEICEWHARPRGVALRFNDKQSALGFLRGFQGKHTNMALMRDILARAASSAISWGPSDEDVLEQLANHLVSGRLRIAPITPPPHIVPIVVEPEEEKELTWIEIQLVDQDNQPVPGEPYQITLPDGTVREGITDSKGLARIEDIEPGTCEVAFPDLDKEAWEPVQ